MRSAILAALGLAMLAEAVWAQPAPAPASPDDAIMTIVNASACREGDKSPNTGAWNEDKNDHDPAPRGFVKGVALTYAKSICDARDPTKAATAVMVRPVGSASSDALGHYQITAATPIERLRAVYTLAMGVAMRESSGNTTAGPCTCVKPEDQTPEKAEAGLYQTSFDSLGKDPSLKPLMTAYQANTGACRLATFMEGVHDLHIPPFGTSGPPVDYQKFTKACPAFATEYVMVMLRVNRTHFGTVNSKHAKFVAACSKMFTDIEAVVTCP